ncbi:MAG: hypothetical protein ABSB28_05325 [Candidatus Bathyarchaeia archaeon]
MAVFRADLTPGEIWDRALNLGGRKLLEGERGSLIEICVPDAPKATVQVFPGGGVTIFCPDLEELRRCETWVNEKLGTPDNPAPLGVSVKVMQLGARPAYYKSLKEIEGMLEKTEFPPDIQPDEFKEFVKCVFGTYCEGKDIVIPALAQITGLDEEKVERYLDFMTKLNFTHMKPPIYQLDKIWHIGCGPEEDQRMRCESFEGAGGAILFESGKRVLRLFRGPLPEIRGICERVGPLVTCPKCNVLIPFRHGTKGRCPSCDTTYFRDPSSGKLVRLNLLEILYENLSDHENSAPQEAQPSIRFNFA